MYVCVVGDLGDFHAALAEVVVFDGLYAFLSQLLWFEF